MKMNAQSFRVSFSEGRLIYAFYCVTGFKSSAVDVQNMGISEEMFEAARAEGAKLKDELIDQQRAVIEELKKTLEAKEETV